jgi:hypothetical protein
VFDNAITFDLVRMYCRYFYHMLVVFKGDGVTRFRHSFFVSQPIPPLSWDLIIGLNLFQISLRIRRYSIGQLPKSTFSVFKTAEADCFFFAREPPLCFNYVFCLCLKCLYTVLYRYMFFPRFIEYAETGIKKKKNVFNREPIFRY